ncbi:hypothetical protein EDD21DRAFT_205937 [Dissophora ornata]|nr:hypothetical protein EDD21DRAFT_205937 [Dissophora ornata]
MNAHKGNTVLPKTQSLPFSPSLSLSLFLLYLLSLVPLLSHPASSFALPFHILCAHASLIASIKNHSILTPSKRKKSKAQHLALLFSPPRMPDITIPQEDNPKPSSLLSSIPTAAAPTSTSPLSTTLRTASNQIPFPPLSPFNDPFTTNIIHDTDDSNLVKTMALVANAGRNAGVAANANAVASARSSASVHSNHNPSPLSSSSSSLASSTKLTTVLPSSEAIAGSRRPTQLGRASVSRPLIEVPQPQSPISLHHALDGTIPVTPVSNPSTTARILPRSIDTHVQDTLAKDSTRQHNASSTSSYGSNSSSASSGPRRIMTPTSRLAETAVGVREVSKKIGMLSRSFLRLLSSSRTVPYFFPPVNCSSSSFHLMQLSAVERN